MPYRERPFFYWKKIIGLLKYSFSFNPKPIFTAAGLLIIGVLLFFVVIGSIRQSNLAIHTPQKEAVQQTQLDQAVLKTTEPISVSQANKDDTSIIPKTPVWPIQGRITKGLGWYENPVLKEWRYHAGFDIEGKEGQTVKAVMDGNITDIVNGASSGLTVVAEHAGYIILYGSLDSVTAHKGDSVQAGSAIGTVGSFPSEPFPHLHISIKRGEQLIDLKEILN